MARVALLSRQIADRSAELARVLVVSGCAFALIAAGRGGGVGVPRLGARALDPGWGRGAAPHRRGARARPTPRR